MIQYAALIMILFGVISKVAIMLLRKSGRQGNHYDPLSGVVNTLLITITFELVSKVFIMILLFRVASNVFIVILFWFASKKGFYEMISEMINAFSLRSLVPCS